MTSPPVGLRVQFYDYVVPPGKTFAYWAVRHLRKIPPEWRSYYHRQYRQEMFACKYLNIPWEVFLAVNEGYRKSKWVLKKYDQEVTADSIPRPYGDFFETT